MLETFLQFFINKGEKEMSAVFFLQLLIIKTLDPYPDSLEMLDPDPDSMNPDPQHCLSVGNTSDSPPPLPPCTPTSSMLHLPSPLFV